MYWMMLYSAMNLKTQKEVMRAARPSLSKQHRLLNPSSTQTRTTLLVIGKKTNLMRLGTQEMLGVFEVKGDATEASSSDKEMPP